MSEPSASYPYWQISRDWHVPYEWVLRYVSRAEALLDQHPTSSLNYVLETAQSDDLPPSMSQGTRALLVARVLRERTRRREVLAREPSTWTPSERRVPRAPEPTDEPPDDCPDCGSPGACAPGCPSRLPDEDLNFGGGGR